MSSLTLYTHEVRHLLATGSVLRVRALNPQPEPGRYGDGRIIGKVSDQIGDGDYCVWRPKLSVVIPMTHGCAYRIGQHLPHAPGTVVACREKWAVHKYFEDHYRKHFRVGIGNIVYFADYQEGGAPITTWRSASTMPTWAVRPELREVRVTSVDVKQVQDVTEEESGVVVATVNIPHPEMGFYYGDPLEDWREIFAHQWDAHAKPGRRWADNPYVSVVTLRREG